MYRPMTGTNDCSIRRRDAWLLYKMYRHMAGTHDCSIRCTDIWVDHMTAL